VLNMPALLMLRRAAMNERGFKRCNVVASVHRRVLNDRTLSRVLSDNGARTCLLSSEGRACVLSCALPVFQSSCSLPGKLVRDHPWRLLSGSGWSAQTLRLSVSQCSPIITC
jgi:hypothetical protein